MRRKTDKLNYKLAWIGWAMSAAVSLYALYTMSNMNKFLDLLGEIASRKVGISL